LREEERASEHRQLHDRFRVDDNARDRAVAIARRANAAADHAAQAIVIYPLQRPGAPELEFAPPPSGQSASSERYQKKTLTE
jgi:hypothetical protein